jgi:hypothetical protein
MKMVEDKKVGIRLERGKEVNILVFIVMGRVRAR